MYDAVIIGGGAVGCAVARELSRWKLKICLAEQGEDVCVGTSKANSAIVHAGFDAPAGSMKARFNVEGSRRMEALSRELDFPYRRNGALVVCFEEAGLPRLEELLQRGWVNGVEGLEILRGGRLHELEPALSEKAVAALYAPTSAIICPFGMTIALAENAAHNGAEFRFDTRVETIRRTGEGYVLETSRGPLETRAVISAAGVWGDVLHNQVCGDTARIVPRRGEYCLLDRKDGGLVQRTVFQLPGPMGKGVLVTPTVHGNLLVGPTAADQPQRDRTATTAEGLAYAQDMARKSVPGLPLRDVITSFAGLRAHLAEGEDDFRIGQPVPGYFEALGIESPGLSSAPAIGAYLAEQAAAYLGAAEKPDFDPLRRDIVHLRELPFEERQRLAAENPAYGNIVCRCEGISEGEIVDAIRRTPGARSLDGGLLHPPGHGDPVPGAGSAPDGADKKRRSIPAAGRADQGGSMMKHVQLAIIGGGPAGLAAAAAARKAGVEDLLIIERDRELGGILNQCIHAGFGLHTFSRELTGPEYARRFADQVRELEIPYLLNTMVLDLSPDRVLTLTGRETGLVQLSADAVILAMGCRERPRGALNIPGCRPAGIYSAGTAQRLVNMEGLMPGRDVVILGSGDIGLIMARRMSLEGCKVQACLEICPFSNGLTRNIVQCLNDYDIPLYLSHTIVAIHGEERVTGITVAKVDERMTPIPGTEFDIECDTVLLSVGLIPENELSRGLDLEMNPLTNGPVVDQHRETSLDGFFAAGNVVHVHDLVDFVSEEAEIAGKYAALKAKEKMATENRTVTVKAIDGVRTCVPQKLTMPAEIPADEKVKLFMRVAAPHRKVKLEVKSGDNVLLSRPLPVAKPSEMIAVEIPAAKFAQIGDEVTVGLVL